MKHGFFTVLTLFSLLVYSQKSFVYADFDHDGKKDKLYVLDCEQGFRLCYTLTSQKNKTISSFLFNECESTSVELKNSIVVVSNYDIEHFYYHYKFEYISELKQFRLIGIDVKRVGNYPLDGPGTSSYNLLTGIYIAHWKQFNEQKNKFESLPIIKRKTPIKVWLLNDYGNDMLWELAQIDIATQPKCLRRNYRRQRFDTYLGRYYPEQKWVFEQ
ncbi:MAG: hypothetical protein WCJ61_06840 [Paludibacter sp.]